MSYLLAAAVERTLLSAMHDALSSPVCIGDKSIPTTLFAPR